jgi:hypothetical protein
MAQRKLRCAIEEVAEWYPHLFLEPHIVSCVAVLIDYSASPAEFVVECDNVTSDWIENAASFILRVSWTRQTVQKAERLRDTMQAKQLVELAAIALALTLAYRLVHLEDIDVTAYGARADYRSLAASRVLEISGTESADDLNRRHRQKVSQALANPFGWDAYVVVCAFSADGHRIRFSGHGTE